MQDMGTVDTRSPRATCGNSAHTLASFPGSPHVEEGKDPNPTPLFVLQATKPWVKAWEEATHISYVA